MSDRRCTKDDPRIPWLCSCDDCARAAAGAWHGYMDRVLGGDLTLAEANAQADRDPLIHAAPKEDLTPR